MQMQLRKIFISLLISSLYYGFVSAQETGEKKDTVTLYRNIESYSKQSKTKRYLYHLFFKPVSPADKKKDAKKKGYKKLIQKPYIGFEGKPVRNIEIISLDPFGNSVNDTISGKQNFLMKAGNTMHIKTIGITIRNLMLIHKNDPFNSLLVKESERLIRSQNFVHDVAFFVVSAGVNNDSVDIFIRELDKWSIIPAGSVSKAGYHFGLTDKNFLGTGHEFKSYFRRTYADGINYFSTNYSIPNIRNTYVKAKFHYEIDGSGYYNRFITIDRPFFSPVAKWAAGMSFASRLKKDSMVYSDPAYIPSDLKFNTRDFWGGRALRIFKGNSDNELVTNLILAARYLQIRYSERPAENIDLQHIYSNEDFYLGEIGISARKYVQDRYIFKFGEIEDVPVGRVYEVTGGYQVKSYSRRQYLGMRFAIGSYNEWGYLSSNLEYGTFFNSSHPEQGVFNAGVNYFTGLFEIGKWKLRQFVKPQVTIGMNRFSYDSLTLKEGYGLNGFNSMSLSGNNRLVITIQTQSYAPWNVFGFHFGPFLTYSLGMLGDAATGFKNSKVYSQLGIGVLIKNENLVFNAFQISISFYPLIPGVGQDVFKMNSYRTYDFGFSDFEVGKPSIAAFR